MKVSSSWDGTMEPCVLPAGCQRRARRGRQLQEGPCPPLRFPGLGRDGGAAITGSSCSPLSLHRLRLRGGCRHSTPGRPAEGRRGGEGEAARGERAGAAGARGGGGLPGTSVSEDSLAELSIGSLGSEDLCKWKLEAMSWEGWGLKLSGSLSKFIPPLKESMAGAPGCLREFAGVYSTQKGTRSFFF